MLKKLIAGAAGAGLVLTMAGAVLAHPRHRGIFIHQDGVMNQDVVQMANSGGIALGGSVRRTSGNSVVQGASLYAEQNFAEVGCGCRKVTIHQDGVMNQDVVQMANSGGIALGGSVRRTSGNSVVQGAGVSGFQNTALVGGAF